MGTYFRKRLKIAPGLHINLSKNGIGTSVGMKGFTVSSGPRGTYVNSSLPGTGLYNRQKIDGKSRDLSSQYQSDIASDSSNVIILLTILIITFIIVITITKSLNFISIFVPIVVSLVIWMVIKSILSNLHQKDSIKIADEIQNESFEKMESNLSNQSIEALSNLANLDDSKLSQYDVLIKDAAKLILEKNNANATILQQQFGIGFRRASIIINQLEELGMIGSNEDEKVKGFNK